MSIRIYINSKEYLAEQGETILKAAQRYGIEIPTLCHDDSIAQYGACGLCVVEIEGRPKLARACATTVAQDMRIITDSPRVLKARRLVLELLMSDHNGDCVAPCSLNCPAHTDVQGYLKEIAKGNYSKATEIIKEKIPLPASIGRVCPHPCETNCRRQYVEEALSIASLKYFAADKDRLCAAPYMPKVKAKSGKTVGIVGGGPAGLTAAYYLAVEGHEVTVYDAMPKMGGMLRYGIPEYRLPKKVLDQEIEFITRLGVKLVNNFKLGKDASVEQLKAHHDAVLLAVGAWSSSKIRCAGEELEGVVGGIDFLREIALGNKPFVGSSAAVIGGGNTAMDACRSAVRLGAKNVYVIYRRTRAEMPAEDIEIEEAMEEGVDFRFLRSPLEIIGENGKVTHIKLQVMELGEPDESGRRKPVAVEGKFELLPVDVVIGAIGQKLDANGLGDVSLNKYGSINADLRNMRTSLKGVFAAGDATNNGAGIAIEAIAEANIAAKAIDAYLCGIDFEYHEPYYSKKEPDKEALASKPKQPREIVKVRAPQERKNDFNEIALGFSEEQARREAKRCLECGCHDYHDCKLIKYARLFEAREGKFAGVKHGCYTEEKLVSIERDQGKCILCGLCVRCCEETVKKGILGLVGRGFTTVIKPEFRDKDVYSFCAGCRKCVDICPTGALKFITK